MAQSAETSQLANEARELALEEVCRLLQNPEDLSRLPSLRADYEKARDANKLQLAAVVQSRIDAAQSSKELLDRSQKAVSKLKACFERIDRLCEECASLVENHEKIQELAVAHHNVNKTLMEIDDVIDLPSNAAYAEEMLTNDALIVEAYKALSSLEGTSTLVKEAMKSNDRRTTEQDNLQAYFEKVGMSARKFEERLWEHFRNFSDLGATNPGLLVACNQVVEMQEMLDTEFPPERRKCFKKRAFGSMEAAIAERFRPVFELCPAVSADDAEKMTEILEDALKLSQELVEIYDVVSPCFPDSSAAFRRLWHCYHVNFGKLLDQLSAMAASMDNKSILDVVRWIETYSETLRGLGIEEEELPMPTHLEGGGLVALMEVYIDRDKKSTTAWYLNILDSDVASEPKMDQDEKLWTPGFVDFFRILNDAFVAVERETKGEMLYRSACSALEMMKEFVVAEQAILQRDVPTHILCAFSNNNVRAYDLAIEYVEHFDEVVSESFRGKLDAENVYRGFLEVAKTATKKLVESVFGDPGMVGLLKKLYQAEWLSGEATSSLVATLQDYLEEFKDVLDASICKRVVEMTLHKAVGSYTAALMTRMPSITEAVIVQMQCDETSIGSFFGELMSVEKATSHVQRLSEMRQLACASSVEDFVFAYLSILDTNPDTAPSIVEKVCSARSDITRSDATEISEQCRAMFHQRQAKRPTVAETSESASYLSDFKATVWNNFFICKYERDGTPSVRLQYSKDKGEKGFENLAPFCFPVKAELTQTRCVAASETYTFTKTCSEGKRTHGYCRKIYWSQTSRCDKRPVVLCLLSSEIWGIFYNKVLEILEACLKHDNLLDVTMAPDSLPAASSAMKFLTDVNVKLVGGVTAGSILTVPLPANFHRGHSIQPPQKITALHSNCPNLECTPFHVTLQVPPLTGGSPDTAAVPLARLLWRLPVPCLMTLIAGLLLERRIIMVSVSKETLSAAVHAASALIYPFRWVQTHFLPILPETHKDYLQAPFPFIVGLPVELQDFKGLDLEDLTLVDLDKGTIRPEPESPEDDALLLPRRAALQRDLHEAVKALRSPTEFEGNQRVAEIMQDYVVRLFKNYRDFIRPIKEEPRKKGSRVQWAKSRGDKAAAKRAVWRRAEKDANEDPPHEGETGLDASGFTANGFFFDHSEFVRSHRSHRIREFLTLFRESQLYEAFITERLESYSLGESMDHDPFENRIDGIHWHKSARTLDKRQGRFSFKEQGARLAHRLTSGKGAKLLKSTTNRFPLQRENKTEYKSLEPPTRASYARKRSVARRTFGDRDASIRDMVQSMAKETEENLRKLEAPSLMDCSRAAFVDRGIDLSIDVPPSSPHTPSEGDYSSDSSQEAQPALLGALSHRSLPSVRRDDSGELHCSGAAFLSDGNSLNDNVLGGSRSSKVVTRIGRFRVSHETSYRLKSPGCNSQARKENEDTVLKHRRSRSHTDLSNPKPLDKPYEFEEQKDEKVDAFIQSNLEGLVAMSSAKWSRSSLPRGSCDNFTKRDARTSTSSFHY